MYYENQKRKTKIYMKKQKIEIKIRGALDQKGKQTPNSPLKCAKVN
jgi:hypothetical protein